MVASIGIPCYFLERLKSFASSGHQLATYNENDTDSGEAPSSMFWTAAFAFHLMGTSVAYIGCVYSMWLDGNSVTQAVINTTITILGIGVGITLTAAAFIHFGKSVGWIR